MAASAAAAPAGRDTPAAEGSVRCRRVLEPRRLSSTPPGAWRLSLICAEEAGPTGIRVRRLGSLGCRRGTQHVDRRAPRRLIRPRPWAGAEEQPGRAARRPIGGCASSAPCRHHLRLYTAACRRPGARGLVYGCNGAETGDENDEQGFGGVLPDDVSRWYVLQGRARRGRSQRVPAAAVSARPAQCGAAGRSKMTRYPQARRGYVHARAPAARVAVPFHRRELSRRRPLAPLVTQG